MRLVRETEPPPTGTRRGERRDLRKFYRFALYGRSGSGKTCVLARMAMGALGHPDGLDCTRLPVTVPMPTTPAEAWSPEELEAAELHAGKDWIDKAVRRLRQNDVPRGNQDREKTREAVDFEITDPRRGATLVRMLDYPGELIDPASEHDPESRTNALKERLRGLDGLIVIADASTRGDRGVNLDDDHRLLREALVSLADDPDFERAAIVIAFTKWDRESRIRVDAPEAEYAKLDDFLAARPVHKALVDAVRSVSRVGGSSDGAARIAFPTSAFGKAIDRADGEFPDPEQARPFGLLEPCLALADLRDSIDAARIEAEAASWTPRRLWILRGRADALLQRMPASSEAARRIRAARQRALRWLAGAAFFAVFLTLAALVTAGGWAVNSWRFQALLSRIEDPGIGEEGLAGVRERLRIYDPGGLARWLPFAPESEQVAWLRARIDVGSDSILWRPVEAASTLSDKAERAEEYLKRLPQGLHADEAKEIIKQAGADLAERDAENWLHGRENQIAEADDDQSRLLEILGELNSWSYSGDDPGKIARRDKLATLCRDGLSARSWNDILGLLGESSDVKGAAQKWAQRAGVDDHWKEHVPELIEKIRAIAKSRVESLLGRKQFEEARKLLADAGDGLAALERPTREHARELIEVVMDARREMGPEGPMSLRASRAEDREMYEEFRNAPSLDLARKYLESDDRRAMREVVRGFQAYLTARNGSTEIEVAASILWDRDYADKRSGQMILIWVDNSEKLKVMDLVSSSGQVSSEIGRFPLRVPEGKFLASSAYFQVRMREAGYVFGTSMVAEGVGSLRFSELEGEGARIAMIPPDGGKHCNRSYAIGGIRWIGRVR